MGKIDPVKQVKETVMRWLKAVETRPPAVCVCGEEYYRLSDSVPTRMEVCSECRPAAAAPKSKNQKASDEVDEIISDRYE